MTSKTTEITPQNVQFQRPAEAILNASVPNNAIFLLESQLPGHPSSDKNYLFSDFAAWITFESGQIKAHIRTPLHPDVHKSLLDLEREPDPWAAISRFRKTFPGYVCGFIAYDLKNYREKLSSDNPDPISLPEMWIGFPCKVHIFDDPVSSETLSGTFTLDHLHPTISKSDYLNIIQEAKHRIHEGDYYEINLSHQLKADFNGSAQALYRDMRARGPVPYAAYIQLPGNPATASDSSAPLSYAGASAVVAQTADQSDTAPHTCASSSDIQICCASPERFLYKSARQLTSDPIKGTRPRGATTIEDDQIKAQLIASDKERAENLMIVDLVRNDLNRVCEPGSVRVDQLFEIQSFATVHQMVSRVCGTLRSDISAEESLAACFPMGSMTGAPKIRAMEDIERLETYRRGLYSGSVGFFTPEGDFKFNVVIRTAIIRQQKLYYPVGGAITADSDPEAEWQETLIKARALGVELSQ
jgi:para-aminobenzoate synthetase component I